MSSVPLASAAARPVMPVLAAPGVAHLPNDARRSMIPAICPPVEDADHLDFARIGLTALLLPRRASRWTVR